MTDRTSSSDLKPDEAVPVESVAEESTSLLGTLTYGLSLPERTARSASAVVGGLVNETAGWLIPAAFRSSKPIQRSSSRRWT